MNNKKKKAERHSGFDAPVYGNVHPTGSKIKKNADGTITIVEPKKKK